MAQTKPHWRGYFLEYDEDNYTIVHDLTFQKIHQLNGKIQGNGSHPKRGGFKFNGTNDQGNLNFKLTFQQQGKELFFAGKKEGGVLSGSWGEDEDCCKGGWKFTYVVPKQGWNGTYKQNNIDQDMHFETFKMEEGKIHAKGTDINGPFTINGTFEPANNKIRFDKIYDNQIAWKYWGDIHGNTIEGNWGADEGDAMGSFCFFKA